MGVGSGSDFVNSWRLITRSFPEVSGVLGAVHNNYITEVLLFTNVCFKRFCFTLFGKVEDPRVNDEFVSSALTQKGSFWVNAIGSFDKLRGSYKLDSH